jgi:hypothetical protein
LKRFPNVTPIVGDPDPETDPHDPHVFGPPGSFPFLKNVLSGLKYCLQNKNFNTNFSKILNFWTEDDVPVGKL